MAAESQSADIPVWFSGTQRWMTGVTRRTTCDDVIYALLVSTGLHETESTDTFAIFEKWREVERPLSARTKILKVWSFWGEEQPNVQLSMRSLDDYFLPGDSSLYMRSRRRHKKSSRHKERHSTTCRHHYKPEYTECSRLRTLEQLVKLVVSQERKIQGLNDRIHETDKLIDKHEAKIHFQRVQQNGMDYVQNSYLNSHSSESSSNSSAEFNNLDLREVKSIFPDSNLQQLEEIVRVCENLGHLKRRVGQERAKIQELTTEVEKLTESAGEAVQLDGEVNTELEEARVQMIRAVTAYVTNEYTERELDRKIDICLAEITAKTEYIQEMQRKISGIEQKDGDTELSERCTNKGYYSSNQQVASSTALPEPAAHNYRSVTSYQDTRYEDSPHPNRATEDHKHYPNRDPNLYNISGQFLRSLQLDKETLAHNSERMNDNSSKGNDSPLDKSSVLNQGHVNNAQYNDDDPVVMIKRDGRSIRKSNRTLQRTQFGRSRSAERSTDARKSSLVSDYQRVNGCEDSNLGLESESDTRKAVVDQYGLEMSTHQGPTSRDSFRSKTNFRSNNPTHDIPSAAIKPHNRHTEMRQLVSSDYERRFEQRQEQTEKKWYEDTVSVHTDILCSENSNRRIEANSHMGSGSQAFLHGKDKDSRTFVDNQQLEGRTATWSVNVCTSGDRENRIPGEEDSFFKDRFLFEQNINGLSRNRLNSNSGGDGIQRGLLHTEITNSPTSMRAFDLAQSEKTALPDCYNGYQNRMLENNIDLSSNFDSAPVQYETGIAKNVARLSSPSKSGIFALGKQTTPVNPGRKIGNSQTETSTRIQPMADDIYRPRAKEDNKSSLNNGLRYQVSSQETTRSGGSPRQEQFSRLLDTYATKPVCEDSLRVLPTKFTDTYLANRNGTHPQHEGVYNTNNIHCARLQDTTSEQHQKLHRNTDATVVHSNTLVTRENISGSHFLNPAVKSSVTPKMIPSLLGKKETVEANISNICSDESQSASRGALYHIVSNKMNKAKSGSVIYQHDNHTCSDASATQKLVHRQANINFKNSINLQTDISHNKVNYQNNGEHPVNNPSLFGFRNCEYNNDPTTSSHSKEYQNHGYSGHKDGYSTAPVVTGSISNNTRDTSERPKGSTTGINDGMHDKAAHTQDSFAKQSSYTSPSIHLNSKINMQSSNTSFQNSVNHAKGYHIGGYRAGRANTVTIQEIYENQSTVKPYPHSRANRVDISVRTNAGDVRERTKLEDVNDSNSDTGLSSMHSDETSNIETLV
ncbi:hypothetical protein BsWGS_08247 [Bradybaena similaris]